MEFTLCSVVVFTMQLHGENATTKTKLIGSMQKYLINCVVLRGLKFAGQIVIKIVSLGSKLWFYLLVRANCTI